MKQLLSAVLDYFLTNKNTEFSTKSTFPRRNKSFDSNFYFYACAGTYTIILTQLHETKSTLIEFLFNYYIVMVFFVENFSLHTITWKNQYHLCVCVTFQCISLYLLHRKGEHKYPYIHIQSYINTQVPYIVSYSVEYPILSYIQHPTFKANSTQSHLLSK